MFSSKVVAESSCSRESSFKRAAGGLEFKHMRTLSEDTSPEVERVLIELLRKASPARKFEMISSAVCASRQLALSGLKMRFPGDSLPILRRRLASMWLGDELAEKVYGPISPDEPAGN